MRKSTFCRLISVLLASSNLLACDDGLPVRYEICDARGDDCNLIARFKTFNDCSRLKEYWAMRCDTSVPGKIICEATTTRSSVSSSRCTK